MTGTVVISLDFELGWGHKIPNPDYVERLRDHTSNIYPRIKSLIDTFDKYDIPGTWGVVGKLLEEGDDPLFHNPQLVEYLFSSETNHDIGLHSYSHQVYDQLSRKEAEKDLQSGVDIMEAYGFRPRSFIFPENRINHEGILPEYGFTSYRTKPDYSFIKRACSIFKPPLESPYITKDIVVVPGSLYLAAPYRPPEIVKFQAIFGLLESVIRNGSIHFWIHPHEVVVKPKRLRIIEAILSKVNDLRSEGEIQVKTMRQISESS